MELSIDTHEALYRQVWCQYIGSDVMESICMSCELTVITPFTFECCYIKKPSDGGDITISNILPLCLHCYNCLGVNENLEDFMRENCLPGLKMFDKNEKDNMVQLEKEDVLVFPADI